MSCQVDKILTVESDLAFDRASAAIQIGILFESSVKCISLSLIHFLRGRNNKVVAGNWGLHKLNKYCCFFMNLIR